MGLLATRTLHPSQQGISLDKLGRICLDILKGAQIGMNTSRVHFDLIGVSRRQMVPRAPDPYRSALNTGSLECAQPRRPPRNRRREALQGE